MQDQCLGWCRTLLWGIIDPRAPPPCALGPRAGSSNGQCWWLTRMTSVWFQRRMWAGGDLKSLERTSHPPLPSIHGAVQEYPLYPTVDQAV